MAGAGAAGLASPDQPQALPVRQLRQLRGRRRTRAAQARLIRPGGHRLVHAVEPQHVKVVESCAFDWQTKGFTKDGKPVSFAEGSSDIVELVNRGEANAKSKGLTPYNPLAKAGSVESTKAAPPYGRASIARAVLVQSLARVDGGAGRRTILDEARQQLSPGPVVAQADGTDPATASAPPTSNVPNDLKQLWSQGERPVDALNIYPGCILALRVRTRAAKRV